MTDKDEIKGAVAFLIMAIVLIILNILWGGNR